MNFIILKKTSTSGVCAWLTDNPFDDDSGVSGAGYDNKDEALFDSCDPAKLLSVAPIIVDLCAMGDDALDEFDDEGICLYSLLKPFVDEERQSELQALFVSRHVYSGGSLTGGISQESVDAFKMLVSMHFDENERQVLTALAGRLFQDQLSKDPLAENGKTSICTALD